MDHPALKGRARRLCAAAALLGASLGLSGCASLRWELEKALRLEGVTNLAFPEAVFEEYACADKQLPWLRIEHTELIPPQLHAGGEFTHRLVYGLCPAQPTEVAEGELEIRILYKGRPIHVEREPAYELWPGRWQVDSFVQLPSDAEPGVYAYELSFRGNPLHFLQRDTFLLLAR